MMGGWRGDGYCFGSFLIDLCAVQNGGPLIWKVFQPFGDPGCPFFRSAVQMGTVSTLPPVALPLIYTEASC